MEAWQVRFMAEARELKERIDKLHAMIVKYDADILGFTPETPYAVLKEQEEAMRKYYDCLIIRADYERIVIE